MLFRSVSDSVSPGYSDIRCVVTVESPAAEAEVLRVLDTADRHSSWLDDYRRALPVSRQVRITAPQR